MDNKKMLTKIITKTDVKHSLTKSENCRRKDNSEL